MGTCTLSAICTSRTSRYASFTFFYLLPNRPTAVRHNITTIESSTMCSIALAFDPELSDNFSLLFHITALVYFALPLLALIIMYFFIGVTVKVRLRHCSECNTKRSFTALSRSTTDCDCGQFVRQSTTVNRAVCTHNSTRTRSAGRRWREYSNATHAG